MRVCTLEQISNERKKIKKRGRQENILMRGKKEREEV